MVHTPGESGATQADKPLLAVLEGERRSPSPVWMMRQAGRYLPEYRALRAEKGSFLNLVYDSDTAAEITLQPLDRFPQLDAAILGIGIRRISGRERLVFAKRGSGQMRCRHPVRDHRKAVRLAGPGARVRELQDLSSQYRRHRRPRSRGRA